MLKYINNHTITMKKRIFSLALMAMASIAAMAQDAYIFTSFREPSTGGMHYLYSYDGLKWDTIPGEWMRPEIGNEQLYVDAFTGEAVVPHFAPDDRVFRDPSITQGPDGTFHLVWTMQWYGAKGFGYAHSKDLINWSKQIAVPVMQNNPTNNVWAPEIFYDDELKQSHFFNGYNFEDVIAMKVAYDDNSYGYVVDYIMHISL